MQAIKSFSLAQLSSDSGCLKTLDDYLAQETPIALVYNGITHAVLMATPQDLSALALGFSLSEGIIQRVSQFYDCEIKTHHQGIELHITIASECFVALKNRRRNLTGRTGCGLCGVESLNVAMPCLPFVQRNTIIAAKEIQAALSEFESHQPLRAKTGSLHAVAWVKDGSIQKAFEDVGRHNALDKLIGALSLQSVDFKEGFLLLSSRASYEMIAKAALVGIGCVVAVSAPTSLAVEIAEKSNITLMAFARQHRQNIYTHPQFIAL